MGVIGNVRTGKNGETFRTEVRTNWLEDFLMNTTGRLFGRNAEWRVVHIIEKRKLRK